MNIQEITEALDAIGAGYIVETSETEDGPWTYARLTNEPPLTLSQMWVMFNMKAELVGLHDCGSDSLIQEVEDLLSFSNGRLAVYPEAPPEAKEKTYYAVTVTTWDTYKVLAESEADAKEIGIGIEKEYNPVTSHAEINVEEWD